MKRPRGNGCGVFFCCSHCRLIYLAHGVEVISASLSAKYTQIYLAVWLIKRLMLLEYLLPDRLITGGSLSRTIRPLHFL